MADYPAKICPPCGRKHGKPRGSCATFYPGTCGWCGADTIVTEPRDYGYPPAPKRSAKGGA